MRLTASVCVAAVGILLLCTACFTPADPGDAAAPADLIAGDLPGGEAFAPETETEELSPEEKYPGEPGAAGIFMQERELFFDQPFPSNNRVRSNGAPDVSDFPNPYDVSLLEDYISVAETKVVGFSNNGAVYFRFDGPLNKLALPNIYSTRNASAAVFLVNVSEDSLFYREFVPVEFWYWDREAPTEDYYLLPNTLAVRPLGGFPMRPGDTYACVVTRRLKDANDNHVGQTELVVNALSGDLSAPLSGIFFPLRKWLDDTAGIQAHDVAVATVFTVSDPVSELAVTADYLRENVEIELVEPVKSQPTANDYDLYVGKYLAPNFQTGDPPYEKDGEIVVEDGVPKVQWMEKITLAITIPKGQPTPVGGWPLVMYSHGTGGSYKTFLKGTAEQFALKGIAGMSIDQPLHGDRFTDSSIDIEFYSFNFANPLAARSLFRQAALDFVALSKFASEFKFTSSGAPISFNSDKFGYMGHSQGGLTGALFLAVESSIKAATLSGAGGGLAYTILLRKQLDSGTSFDIKTALEGVLNLKYDDELTLFHPVLTLAQTLVEITDPLNYSQLYFYPRFRKDPLNVLITEGVDDPYTPAVTTDNLALAGLIPPIAPQVHSHIGFDLLDLKPVSAPVMDNMILPDGTKATAGLAQFSDYGHYVAFQDATCEKMWMSLFTSSLLQGTPRIAK